MRGTAFGHGRARTILRHRRVGQSRAARGFGGGALGGQHHLRLLDALKGEQRLFGGLAHRRVELGVAAPDLEHEPARPGPRASP